MEKLLFHNWNWNRAMMFEIWKTGRLEEGKNGEMEEWKIGGKLR